MTHNYTTVPHCLRLVDVERVVVFSELHQEAVLRVAPGAEVEMTAMVPGTLKLSDQMKDDVAEKRHTFEIRNEGAHTLRQLELLAKSRLMALYEDEKGVQRVSGAPLYPLALTYQQKGGTLQCTITGRTPWLDLPVRGQN